MTFLKCFNTPKLDFTQNQSGVEIIKYQQNQVLNSHFESFGSIVYLAKHSYDYLCFSGIPSHPKTSADYMEACSHEDSILKEHGHPVTKR